MKNPPLVLGSQSPRRSQLLRDLGLEFRIAVSDADEIAPADLSPANTVEWVAEQKAKSLMDQLEPGEWLLTADTEVWKDHRRFGKPANATEAKHMLESLSGTTHQVISGFCVCNRNQMETHHVITEVVFNPLTQEQIEHYVEQYKPFDKAGAYGIQEWIGMVGIHEIKGSYYNVMGLPTTEVYEVLQRCFRQA